MDIKDLNKSQLLLLAIFLSFITSIATGITTVTLMEQAPETVTVPINRVVRQTVEKIQQVEGKTTVQTVIVKEEDLVVEAIAESRNSSFVLTKEIENDNEDMVEVSAGRAFVVSNQDIIVADSMFVPGEGVYFAENDSGKFRAEFIRRNDQGFSFLRLGPPLDESKKLLYTVPTFRDLGEMKVGQKILVFGNGISSIIFEGEENIKITPQVNNAGGMVINLEGEVLGIALYNEENAFVPISNITEALKSI